MTSIFLLHAGIISRVQICLMQDLGYSDTKKYSFFHLKFKFNWTPIFVC